MQNDDPERNDVVPPDGELLPREHPWNAEAGQNLKRLRESLKKGQGQLGVSRGMIALLEKGETRPGRDTLRKIAEALGVSEPALLPPDSREGAAYREGVVATYRELVVTLSDLRRRLGLAEGTPVDPSLVGVGVGVARYLPQNPVPGSQGQPKPQEKTKETG